MGDNMQKELPQPAEKPVEGIPIKQSENPHTPVQSFAEHWVKKQGLKPQEVQDPTDETTIFAQEAYDLFLEKQNLQIYLQRNKPSSEVAQEVVPLELKLKLIEQGDISEILATFQTSDAITMTKERVKVIEERLNKILSTPGVYQKYQEGFQHEIQVRKQAKEVDQLARFIEGSREQILKLARDAQVTGHSLTSVEGRVVLEYRALTDAAKERIDELMDEDEVRLQVRSMELKRYKKELSTDGFVETPSRQKYVTELEALWSQGKKILVTGATGTGKTELVRHASRRMFGIKPFEITGHEKMTPYELLGRTGMTGGQDVYRPSKLIQAMVAEDGKGAPFLYDEMDASPNQANIALKTILNDGPGDSVSIQMDSDRKFVIGPNYSFTGTANVKSEKHQTRFEIDPAIVRILEPIIVPYMPPAEVWDIAVASLIDKHGGLSMSREDAERTLKDLADSSAWTQQAYLGEKIVTDEGRGSFLEARGGATTGKPASLKEAVLDPGRVTGMLKGWEGARLEGKDLRTFLDDQIIRFINNENFPEDDRYYLIEIFALKGFLKRRSIEEFKVHTSTDRDGFNQKVFESWTGGAEAKEEESETSYLAANQVVRLDPYKRFGESLAAVANQLLQGGPEDSQAVDANLEFARSLLGEDFLGPEEIEKAFGIRISPDEIPPIPFDQSELENAKRLNQRLVLRWDRGPNGEELTMKALQDLLQSEFSSQGKGKVLYNTDWYNGESFFTQETPRVKWSLVTNEVIPNSTSRNYVEQTSAIIEYLTQNIYGSVIPQELANAMSEFTSQKAEITSLLDNNYEEAARRLANLSITKLTRQTPVEALYDTLLYMQNNDKRLLPNIYNWTGVQASEGGLVYVGYFDEEGFYVVDDWPFDQNLRLGVCLSL